MSAPSVVVVAMSVREAQDLEGLAGLAGLADQVGGTVAHLQLGDPSLARELTRLADGGASRVILVGVSLGRLAPGVSWLRRIAAHWWRERGEPRPVVEVATRLAANEQEVAAVLEHTRPVTGAEAGLTSAAWEDAPGHRHQVLVCRGPRCTALGADETAEALVLALMERGLGDDDVLLTHTGCQFPCNRAPVISVQPDDVWYGGVDRQGAADIVDEHLVGGRPHAPLRLPRERRPRPG